MLLCFGFCSGSGGSRSFCGRVEARLGNVGVRVYVHTSDCLRTDEVVAQEQPELADMICDGLHDFKYIL